MEEASANECPVSLITPQSRYLAQLLGADYYIHEATGSRMLGGNSARWPAWWYDAVAVAEKYRILENNARVEAELNR